MFTCSSLALEADLDMVQAGLLEFGDARLGEADAGGDEVGVVAEPARLADEFGEVLAHQGFAAGKADLGRTHLPRLGHHPEPLLGGQLAALGGEVQGIGAIGALQRTAIGDLGQQPQRQADRRLAYDRRLRQLHGHARQLRSACAR
ncbi:hypothetical protein Q3H58_002406 [Pseudomonas psychrotolerans]|nr:hypothetical protein [Pseudomonas psychrotolerans]